MKNKDSFTIAVFNTAWLIFNNFDHIRCIKIRCVQSFLYYNLDLLLDFHKTLLPSLFWSASLSVVKVERHSKNANFWFSICGAQVHFDYAKEFCN